MRADVYSRRSAELFWQREPAALALRYEIRRDGQVVGTTDGVSYYTNALAGGTDYAFEVIAIDRQGRRSAPSPIGLRTDGGSPSTPSTPPAAGAPSAPAELRFDVYSSFAVELFWRREPAAQALRYEIRRDGQVVGTTNGVSYNTSSLRPGTDFAFEVIAIDRDQRRSTPTRIAVRTDGPARPVDATLAAPANLRAEVYSRTAAELFWDRAAMPGLSYEIRRNGDLVGTTNGTSFYDNALASGTTYRYEVTTLGSGRRSNAATVEARTAGSAQPTSLEVRDSFTAIDRPAALDDLDQVSRFFEESLPDDRPYSEQRETSIPFSRGPLAEGLTESVLIDIDAGGTGTYSDVSRREDSDTIRRESEIATRTHDGNSVVWMGTYAFSDSSSGIQEDFEFMTEISTVGEQRRLLTGQFSRERSGGPESSLPIDVTYELTTGVIEDGSEGCFPFTGEIVYDSGAIDRDGLDVTNVVTSTTINKGDGDVFWTVRETNLDGSVRDEYLVADIGLTPFCDFPELR